MHIIVQRIHGIEVWQVTRNGKVLVQRMSLNGIRDWILTHAKGV